MNNNDNDYNLMGITVGGFQVFDAPTFIPLRSLTFLFGPNSAGKSAIEDAIQIIFDLFQLNSKNLYPESWTKKIDGERLERHWRRLNEDKEPESYAPTMTLGATVTLITDLTSALVTYVNRRLLENKWSIEREKLTYPLKIDFLAAFSHASDPYVDADFSTTHDFTLLIDQKSILVFEDEHFKLNFGHPVLAAFELENNFAAIALKYPEVIDYNDGWIKTACFHAGNGIQAILGLAGVEKSKSLNLDAHIAYCESLYESPIPTDLKNALTEISIFANELHDIIIGNLQFSSPSVVKASRTIPTTDDLTFFHGSDAPAAVRKSFPIKNTGDDQYRKLTGGLRETVNRMFDHLFIDRGYQLSCDHRVIISPEAYHNLPDAIEYGEHIYHLQLVDAQKRMFEFEDVGSGLGYVLPILCSACDRDIEISILQQPELHLHPALQSELGDVFIECLSVDTTQDYAGRRSFFCKQFVIETHSEHLLLRVLKRIRQTNSDRPPATEQQIKASDVSVLYFDPSLDDGTTKVKHLRISDDGEFIDRWPRGFFTERDQDLFDE